MKNKVLLFAIIVLMVTACFNLSDEESIPEIYENNITKINIGQGIAGTVIYMEGNFQPVVINPPENFTYYDLGTCFPVRKIVQLYELTSSPDVKYSDTSLVFIDSIGTTMISETVSDANGFYQLSVPDTGKYSIFIIYGNQHFVEYWGSDHLINPIEVLEDSVIIHNIEINHNTCW
jgi:hypothetical protein